METVKPDFVCIEKLTNSAGLSLDDLLQLRNQSKWELKLYFRGHVNDDNFAPYDAPVKYDDAGQDAKSFNYGFAAGRALPYKVTGWHWKTVVRRAVFEDFNELLELGQSIPVLCTSKDAEEVIGGFAYKHPDNLAKHIFITAEDFDRLTGKSEQRTKEWVDVNGRSDYWKDKDSMTGLITDWCEDLGLPVREYLKDTRDECLKNIKTLSIKQGCEWTGKQMKYGYKSSALYSIRSIGKSKATGLIRESWGK